MWGGAGQFPRSDAYWARPGEALVRYVAIIPAAHALNRIACTPFDLIELNSDEI